MHDSINLSLNSQSFDTKVYRIFDSEWQTETLDWFGNKDIPEEEKEQFIQALISFEDKCGNFYYYRAYLFAAEAIAYFPESRLGDVIVEQVLKWGYAYFRSLKQDWEILPQPLVISAREVISKTDKQRVVGAYTQLLHSTESRSVLRVAAKHLAKLAPENSTAIAALVLLLKFSPNEDTTHRIVRDLEEIGCGNETVIACLINLMQTTLNKNTCIRAIKALGKVANGNTRAIIVLVEFLQINRGDNICMYVVECLWHIDPDNTVIIKTLLDILDSHQGLNIIWLASDFIAKIFPSNREAEAILLTRIAIAEDRCTLWNLIECLVKIDPGNQAAMPMLLTKLQAAETEEFRYLFAASIVNIQPDNTEAVTTLLNILENSQDEGLKYSVACTLVEINPENKHAVALLNPTTAERQIAWNRLRKAEKLVQIPEQLQQGISLLFKSADLLGYGEDHYGFLPAISILEKIDKTRKLTIQALVKVIETTSNMSSREYALAKLAQLEPDDKLVVEKVKHVVASLVQLIQNCESQNSESFQEKLVIEHCNYLFYRDYMQNNSSIWGKIFQSHELKQIVIVLKQYLVRQLWEKDFERYDIAYNIIWNCAQNITCSEFYLVWYS